MNITMTARHIQGGDHFNGVVVCQTSKLPDGTRSFLVAEPYTVNSYTITVPADNLDIVKFDVTKRGDDHNPNPRNRELGLPEVVREPYVAPEPIAVYPVGTYVKDIREFDRGQKVIFACPKHLEIFASKNPYASNWFPASLGSKACPQDCPVGTGDHVLAEEYKPTRNG